MSPSFDPSGLNDRSEFGGNSCLSMKKSARWHPEEGQSSDEGAFIRLNVHGLRSQDRKIVYF